MKHHWHPDSIVLYRSYLSRLFYPPPIFKKEFWDWIKSKPVDKWDRLWLNFSWIGFSSNFGAVVGHFYRNGDIIWLNVFAMWAAVFGLIILGGIGDRRG